MNRLIHAIRTALSIGTDEDGKDSKAKKRIVIVGSEFMNRFEGFTDELAELNVILVEYSGNGPLSASIDNSKTYPNVRVAYGNGLRPEIWTQFQALFNIKKVVEFYGSTEGNANLVNNTGVVGAIGVVPRLLFFVYPVRLAKCDLETGELVRNEKGLVESVTASDEPGQLLGLMNDSHPSRRCDGYSDKKATKSKIINYVVKEGDS